MSNTYFDFEELYAAIHNISDSKREDDDFLEDHCFEKYDMDLMMWVKVAQSLLPHAAIGESAISGERYRGFAVDNVMHVKQALEADNG